MKNNDQAFDQIIGKMEISLNMVEELETMLSDLSERAHRHTERERLVATPGVSVAATRYLRQ
jgi:hypothetical protein